MTRQNDIRVGPRELSSLVVLKHKLLLMQLSNTTKLSSLHTKQVFIEGQPWIRGQLFAYQGSLKG